MDFQVNPFSCGNHIHYENYLRFSAVADAVHGHAFTHVVVDEVEGQSRISGFISLRASSLLSNDGEAVRGDAALEIVELAVDKRCEKTGVGTLLLDYAVALAEHLNEYYLSARYIVLCADRQAAAFYERYGFRRVTDYGDVPHNGANDDCIPMFLKIKT